MASLFGSCCVLLGQAGGRTLLFLSGLAFRDAKYDTHSIHLSLLLFETPISLHQTPCYEAASQISPALVFLCLPRARSGPALCHSTTPSASLPLSQRCWWDLKPSNLEHTTQVTRLSAESVSVCHPDCVELSLAPNKAHTALLCGGFQRFNLTHDG